VPRQSDDSLTCGGREAAITERAADEARSDTGSKLEILMYRKRILPTVTDADLDRLARKALHEKVSEDK
jgi:hypothetical protein